MLGPLQQARQMPVFWFGFPDRRAFRQSQLGPAPAGLPLLAGQPVAERVDEVIVRELIVALGRPARAAAPRPTSLPGRSG